MSDTSTTQNQSLLEQIAATQHSPQKKSDQETSITPDQYTRFLTKKNQSIQKQSGTSNIPKILDLQNITADFFAKGCKSIKQR